MSPLNVTDALYVPGDKPGLGLTVNTALFPASISALSRSKDVTLNLPASAPPSVAFAFLIVSGALTVPLNVLLIVKDKAAASRV